MSESSKLRLASHVRACHCNGQVILLDLRHGKYIGIGGRQLTAFARMIEGWPGHVPEQTSATESVDVDMFSAPLLKQGLLTRQPIPPTFRPRLPEASATLNGEDIVDRVQTGPRRVLRFIRSAFGASLSLRYCSLLRITKGLASRRIRLAQRPRHVRQEAVLDAVGAYQKLRPLLFTAHERCLHDSLALLHFLAAEKIIATWVIA